MECSRKSQKGQTVTQSSTTSSLGMYKNRKDILEKCFANMTQTRSKSGEKLLWM
ncbi:hypothetical protein LguiA_007225 [Lonicera macranthoides]